MREIFSRNFTEITLGRIRIMYVCVCSTIRDRRCLFLGEEALSGGGDGGGDLDVGADRGGGVATVGVTRRWRRGRDGRRDEGGDVRPPVVPGDDLDCPAIRVATVFGPHPVVVP